MYAHMADFVTLWLIFFTICIGFLISTGCLFVASALSPLEEFSG
jgi:hypothetical protein